MQYPKGITYLIKTGEVLPGASPFLIAPRQQPEHKSVWRIIQKHRNGLYDLFLSGYRVFFHNLRFR